MNQAVNTPTFSVVSSSRGKVLAPIVLSRSVGFFFAFRLFSVLLSVRVLGQEAKTGVGAALALNYLLLAIVTFHSFGPAKRSFVPMLHLPCFRWVAAFLSFTGLSLLWSSAASLASAIAFWVAMAADAGIVLLLLRTGPVKAVAEAVMAGYVWGTCAIAAVAWILPSQSDLRLGDEELLGPNQIGYVCAFALFFIQYLMRCGDGKWSLQAALLAVTLLRSLSKTTIIACIAAQAYILLRDRTITRRTRRVLVSSSLLILIVFSGLLASYYDVYTHAGNQSETLTGRLGIWAYFLNEAWQQPWIGHGFHSVWKVIPPFGADQFEARHAHNELLQQFYAYGLIGIAMLASVYGSVFHNLRTLPSGSMKVLFQGMLLFVLVRGLADTEAFDLSMPMWCIVMIGSLIAESRSGQEVIV